MKNLLIFLFGVSVGAGGTLIWLRKDIKKQLEEIKKQEETKKDDVPFQMNDGEKEEKVAVVRAKKGPVAPKNEDKRTGEKVAYNKVEPLDPEPEVVEEDFGSDETDGGVYEIDSDEMLHNHDYEKENLVYYKGDRIMATEAGTIISNPFMLVGGEWENCVGNYSKDRAFIRNPKLMTDYEILVEDCLYSDEFGMDDSFREG